MSYIQNGCKRRKSSRKLDYYRNKIQFRTGNIISTRSMSAHVNTPLVQNTTTLKSAIQDFMDERKARNLTENALQMYAASLKKLSRHVGINTAVEEITLDDLRAFMREEERKGMAPKTRKTQRQCIKTFFKFLVDEEILDKDPSIRLSPVKIEKRTVVAMKIADVQSIIDIFDKSTELGCRNRLLTLIMIDTGARVGEVVEIKLEDIDLDSKTIKIMGKGRKERLLNIHSQTKRDLSRYIRKFVNVRKEPSPYLFPNHDGKPITRQAAYKAINKAGKKAGVQGAGPHVLRRTFASAYAASSHDPFALRIEMGHNDIRTTMRYVSTQQDEVNRKHELHSPVKNLSTRRKKKTTDS